MTLLPSHPMLQWLDDETLFSLISRHHAISGAVRARDTCERFFGHARAGCQHDLPCNIDQLVARTRGVLGDSKSIIQSRTLLPYYLPFRNEAVAAEAVEILRGSTQGSLKYKLGLLTSRFRAHHPLKACSRCMENDVHRQGVAYWHRSHQFPGVWCCPVHEVPLQQSTLKANGVERFFWHLPSTSRLISAPTEQSVPVIDALTQRIVSLARLTRDYIQWGKRVDEVRLLQAYYQALGDRGQLTAGGGLKLARIAKDFLEHVQPLRSVAEFDHLPRDNEAASVQVGRLLRPPRTGTHPLRHLILIDWLFGDWQSFVRAYSTAEYGAQKSEQGAPEPPDEARDKLLVLLRDERTSLTESARIVGVDVATAMGWARQAGFNPRSRPKVLRPERLKNVQEQLLRGDSTAEVAARQRLSVPTISRILRADPNLASRTHEARRSRALDAQRALWTNATIEHPTLSAKALRTLIPACYAWLYRNDRPWLTNAVAALPAAAPLTASRVDWNARDLELEALVERTVLQLVIEARDRPVQLWSIYQRVPELKAKLGHLDRLPRTRMAIERAVTRRRSSPGGLFPQP